MDKMNLLIIEDNNDINDMIVQELLARIHVQLRKKNKTSSNSSIFKKLVLNSEKFDASIDETP